MRKENEMSIVARITAAVVLIPVLMFGVYVIIHGHLTPGGGFPGGAVMATGVVMFLIVFGNLKGINDQLFILLESLGLIGFALLAFLGISKGFFNNFLANTNSIFGMSVSFGANPGYINTGGVIPLMNMAVGLEVFAALSLIVFIMFKRGE